MKLTDTHCHLDFGKFDSDREAVLERALLAGVDHILIPGLNLTSSLSALALSERHPMLFAAVGIHPTESSGVEYSLMKEIQELARHPKVRAIGEIGLDYYWDSVPHHQQQVVLKQQLALAAELNLPVVIHYREKADASSGDCATDLLKILEEWRTDLLQENNPLSGRPGVLHSFSGNLEMAKAVMNLGFFIGVTGPVTFKNALKRQELVAALPLDHILIETDAPFQTPHPHRGKRNEPAFVRLIADKIGFVQSHTTEQVASVTCENANRLFAWE